MGLLKQRLGRHISARRNVFDGLGQLAAAYDDAEAAPQPIAVAPSGSDPAAGRGLLMRLAELVKRA